METLENGIETGMVSIEDIELLKEISFEDEDFEGFTLEYIVQVAVENGMLGMVKYLHSIGIDLRLDRSIQYASLHGYLEMVQYLISLGANFAVDNNAPVRYAAEEGRLDVVKYLVKMGADITAWDHTAIKEASYYGHIETVEYLLSIGGDFEKLIPEHKEYFKMKRSYSKWRRVHLRKWIRRVLTPLYFSPKNRGGSLAKKDLEAILA